MKRIYQLRAVPALTFVILLPIAMITLCLNSCGSTVADPAPGTAIELSADRNARAKATSNASDAAEIDAAGKAGKANALEKAAKDDPTPARIEAAVAARIDAESAQAVADAMAKVSAKADADAKKASEAAAKERVEMDKANDDRQWVKLCRWIGLAGVAAGALLGGVLGVFTTPRLGVPVGIIIAGTGLLVVAFGATVTWLPLALAGVVIAGAVVWALAHQRSLTVGVALSKALDAVRGEAVGTADQALESLDTAMSKSGLRNKFKKARLRWRRDKQETQIMPVVVG